MGLFNIHKKKFTYQSDAQLKEALINKKGKQQQQDAFDYVFNKYDALLKNLVKSTFEVSEEEAKQTLNKRCTELKDHLLGNNCAELNLYNPNESPFENWFATKAKRFFKLVFNTDLYEKYRKGDPAIVYKRYKKEFEEKIKLRHITDPDIIKKDAEDLSQDLYIHLFKDNGHRLNTYTPSKEESFDAWFNRVLRNFTVDWFRKKTKKSNEDVYDSIPSKKAGGRTKKSEEDIRSNTYSDKNDDEVIEQRILFRIDNQNISPDWEKRKLDKDDEEREKIIEFMRGVMKEILSHRDYNILVDYYFNGMEYAEIAEKYNVKIGNLYNIIRRAIKSLRKKMKEYGYKTKERQDLGNQRKNNRRTHC